MKKLNRLDVCFVFTLEQIQNLVSDEEAIAQYKKERELEKEQKEKERDDVLHEEASMDHSMGASMLKQDYSTILDSRDDRGNYLPKDLGDSIVFTKAQIKQLFDTKYHLKIHCDQKRQEYIYIYIYIYIYTGRCQQEKAKIEKTKEENKKRNKEKEAMMKQFNDELLLRFGKPIELDHLVNRGDSAKVYIYILLYIFS